MRRLAFGTLLILPIFPLLLNASLQETSGDIGAALVMSEGLCRVTRIFPGGPLERSELKPGDIILRVDGKSVTGLELSAVVELVRGKPGSSVTLAYRPAKDLREMDLTILRWAGHPDRSTPRIKVVPSGGVLIVESVRLKSSAEDSGLKAGYWIVKVDGQPLEGMHREVAKAALEGPADSTVVLTVRDSYIVPDRPIPPDQEIRVLREKPLRDLFDQALERTSAGKHEEAVDLLTRHLESNRGEYEAYAQRALAYQSLGKYDLALKDAETFIDKRTTIFRGYQLRADLYYAMQKYELAIKDYDEALSEDNKLEVPYSSRAWCNLHLGRIPQAAEDLKKFESRRPGTNLCHAEWLLSSGEFAEAVRYLNQFLAQHPADAFGYSARGRAYFRLGEYGIALDDAEYAVKLDKKETFITLLGRAAVRAGQYPRCVEVLTPYLDKHRDDSSSRAALAEALFFLDKWEDSQREAKNCDTASGWAVKMLNDAASGDRKQAAASFEVSIRSMDESDLESVRQILDAALRQQPGSGIFQERKKALVDATRAAACYQEFRSLYPTRREDAQKLLDEALLKCPSYSDARYSRGCILYSAGKFDEAVASLKLASTEQYPHALALTMLGNMFTNKGDTAKALEYFRSAYAADRTLEAPKIGLGVVALKDKSFILAESQFTELLDKNPQLHAAWYWRGETWRVQKRLDLAMRDFEKCLAVNPAVLEARFGLGLCLFDLKRNSEAAAQFEKAADQGYEVASCRYNQAVALAQNGENRRARTVLNEALRLDSSLKDFYIQGDPPKTKVAAAAPSAPPVKAHKPCTACAGTGSVSFTKVTYLPSHYDAKSGTYGGNLEGVKTQATMKCLSCHGSGYED